MREIRFRAWDKSHKRMYYSELGDLVWWPDARAKSGIPIPFAQQPYGEWYSDIMQYTGLKDKNGREIYEGDFVVSKNAYESNPKGVVIFSEGGFDIGEEGWSIGSFNAEHLEIIGNIHEHSQLLSKDTPHAE